MPFQYTKVLVLFLFFCFHNINFSFSQCTGSGSIVSSGSGALGNPATLDPDSDGDIVASGTEFSGCTGELAEFEALTNSGGCSTCQVPWTPLSSDDAPSDLWSGSGCGNTDIVGDNAAGDNFAYFTIMDPDGTCDNGDELIAFRLRISNNFSGNFSFDFLVSNDGLTGLNDPDGFVCCSKVTNAGFEYEVQLKTGGGASVNVIDIDGLAGSDNCGGSPDPCISYTVAVAAQKSLACGSSCTCKSSGGTPVFLTYFIKLSDIGANCSNYTNLTFVPVTSNSGNPVISSCTSVADVGGAADLSQALLDCPSCSGVTYSGCTAAISEEGCILSCTAEANSFASALPVELKSIEGILETRANLIRWETVAEINADYFTIERSTTGRDQFITLGSLPARGNSSEGAVYNFRDHERLPISYYRIKFVDFDGSFHYSNTVALQRAVNELKIQKVVSRPGSTSSVSIWTPSYTQQLRLFISDINGRIIWEERNLPTGTETAFNIPTQGYPRGLYFIILTDGINIISERLIF